MQNYNGLMKKLNPISFKRLRETDVSGNFTINCDSVEDFLFVRSFFNTASNNITFKNIKRKTTDDPFLKAGDKASFHQSLKFIIRYENLQQLLKLREIFNVRGQKFDTYLIDKRKYNPLDDSFFTKLTEPIKIIKK